MFDKFKTKSDKRDKQAPQIFDAANNRDGGVVNTCEFLNEISKEAASDAVNTVPDEAKQQEDNNTYFKEEKESEDNTKASAEDGGNKTENEGETVKQPEGCKYSIDEAEEEYRKIIARANDEREKILAEANVQKSKILCEAENERLSAENERTRIIGMARNEQNNIINAAHMEAENITAAARVEHDKLIGEAKVKAQSVIEDAKLKAREDARKIIEERIAESFENRRDMETRMRVDMDDAYKKLSDTTFSNKKEINNAVTEIVRRLNCEVEDALIKMQGIKNEMYSAMLEWEKGLYKAEYRNLAMCFNNLTKLTDGFERRLGKELSYGEEGYHADYAKELEKSVKSMRIFKDNLERAVAVLGIKVYFPKTGSEFNEMYHICNNGEGDMSGSYNGRRITKCINPGLIHFAGDKENILIAAEVEIEL